MKFYKIKLPQGPGGLQYPPNYQQLLGDHNVAHLYYDDEVDGFAYLILSIHDGNTPSSLPENVSEITEAEAKALGDKYDPSVERITSEAVVRRVEIKSRLGVALTSDEERAIDPTDPTLGFGLSEGFSGRIDKVRAIETNRKVKEVK